MLFLSNLLYKNYLVISHLVTLSVKVDYTRINETEPRRGDAAQWLLLN